MTPERITQSLAQKKLALTPRQWVFYYAAIAVLALFAPVAVFLAAESPFEVFQMRTFWLFQLTFMALAFGLYIKQQRQLRLKYHKTQLKRPEIDKVIAQVAEERSWVIVLDSPEVVIAKTPASWLSWGEHIVLLFGDEDIWITSICDPDRSASVMDGGQNKKNIKAFFRLLTQASESQQE